MSFYRKNVTREQYSSCIVRIYDCNTASWGTISFVIQYWDNWWWNCSSAKMPKSQMHQNCYFEQISTEYATYWLSMMMIMMRMRMWWRYIFHKRLYIEYLSTMRNEIDKRLNDIDDYDGDDLTITIALSVTMAMEMVIASAFYQIRKIAGCACTGNTGDVFPATDFKGNR